MLWFRESELPDCSVGYTQRHLVLKELYEEYNRPLLVTSNEGYRRIIEQDLECYFYFYKETNLNEGAGKCYVTIRLIVLDERLKGNQYCVTFAHELMHLKKFRKQESYICFETFKYLYENSKLHNSGVWYAIKQLEGAYSGEYNISNQIVDYLTNK